MEDDDLYEDLPQFDHSKILEKLQSSNKSLEEENFKLKEELKDLKEKFDELHSKFKTVSLNISTVIKTARSEIKRKDIRISELNKEVAISRTVGRVNRPGLNNIEKSIQDRRKHDLELLKKRRVQPSPSKSKPIRDKKDVGFEATPSRDQPQKRTEPFTPLSKLERNPNARSSENIVLNPLIPSNNSLSSAKENKPVEDVSRKEDPRPPPAPQVNIPTLYSHRMYKKIYNVSPLKSMCDNLQENLLLHSSKTSEAAPTPEGAKATSARNNIEEQPTGGKPDFVKTTLNDNFIEANSPSEKSMIPPAKVNPPDVSSTTIDPPRNIKKILNGPDNLAVFKAIDTESPEEKKVPEVITEKHPQENIKDKFKRPLVNPQKNVSNNISQSIQVAELKSILSNLSNTNSKTKKTENGPDNNEREPDVDNLPFVSVLTKKYTKISPIPPTPVKKSEILEGLPPVSIFDKTPEETEKNSNKNEIDSKINKPDRLIKLAKDVESPNDEKGCISYSAKSTCSEGVKTSEIQSSSYGSRLLSKHQRTMFPPISSQWTETAKATTVLKPPMKSNNKENSSSVNKISPGPEASEKDDDIMEALFGSPLKWTENSSEDMPTKLNLPASTFEDSCSAQIENAKFEKFANKEGISSATKTVTEVIVSKDDNNMSTTTIESRISVQKVLEQPRRPFEEINRKNEVLTYSPLKIDTVDACDIPSFTLTTVSETVKSIRTSPVSCPRYQDSILGQFDDTTQLVSALARGHAKISPIHTPVKRTEISPEQISPNFCPDNVAINKVPPNTVKANQQSEETKKQTDQKILTVPTNNKNSTENNKNVLPATKISNNLPPLFGDCSTNSERNHPVSLEVTPEKKTVSTPGKNLPSRVISTGKLEKKIILLDEPINILRPRRKAREPKTPTKNMKSNQINSDINVGQKGSPQSLSSPVRQGKNDFTNNKTHRGQVKSYSSQHSEGISSFKRSESPDVPNPVAIKNSVSIKPEDEKSPNRNSDENMVGIAMKSGNEDIPTIHLEDLEEGEINEGSSEKETDKVGDSPPHQIPQLSVINKVKFSNVSLNEKKLQKPDFHKDPVNNSPIKIPNNLIDKQGINKTLLPQDKRNDKFKIHSKSATRCLKVQNNFESSVKELVSQLPEIFSVEPMTCGSGVKSAPKICQGRKTEHGIPTTSDEKSVRELSQPSSSAKSAQGKVLIDRSVGSVQVETRHYKPESSGLKQTRHDSHENLIKGYPTFGSRERSTQDTNHHENQVLDEGKEHPHHDSLEKLTEALPHHGHHEGPLMVQSCQEKCGRSIKNHPCCDGHDSSFLDPSHHERLGKDHPRHDSRERLSQERPRHDSCERSSKENPRHDSCERSSKERTSHDSSERSSKERSRHDSCEKLSKERSRQDSSERSSKERSRQDSSERSSKERSRHDSCEKLSKERPRLGSCDISSKEHPRHDSWERSSKECLRHDSCERSNKERPCHNSHHEEKIPYDKHHRRMNECSPQRASPRRSNSPAHCKSDQYTRMSREVDCDSGFKRNRCGCGCLTQRDQSPPLRWNHHDRKSSRENDKRQDLKRRRSREDSPCDCSSHCGCSSISREKYSGRDYKRTRSSEISPPRHLFQGRRGFGHKRNLRSLQRSEFRRREFRLRYDQSPETYRRFQRSPSPPGRERSPIRRSGHSLQGKWGNCEGAKMHKGKCSDCKCGIFFDQDGKKKVNFRTLSPTPKIKKEYSPLEPGYDTYKHSIESFRRPPPPDVTFKPGKSSQSMRETFKKPVSIERPIRRSNCLFRETSVERRLLKETRHRSKVTPVRVIKKARTNKHSSERDTSLPGEGMAYDKELVMPLPSNVKVMRLGRDQGSSGKKTEVGTLQSPESPPTTKPESLMEWVLRPIDLPGYVPPFYNQNAAKEPVSKPVGIPLEENRTPNKEPPPSDPSSTPTSPVLGDKPPQNLPPIIRIRRKRPVKLGVSDTSSHCIKKIKEEEPS